MPKLLFVTTIAATLRAFLLPLATHFRALGWQVDALAAGATTCGECVDNFDRVFDASWGRDVFAFWANARGGAILREVVQRGDYDIIHLHTPIASMVGRLALHSRKRRPRVIYTAHGFHFYQGGAWGRNLAFIAMEKFAGYWTDALVVINDEDLQSARRLDLVPKERIFYMPGIGVDVERFTPTLSSINARERLRLDLEIKSGETVFMQVADFIPRKRHADLIRAFAEIEEGSPKLLLAGDGPERSVMQRLAHELGVLDRVKFLGMRSDISELLHIVDALLLVSCQEGLPRSVLEAMAVGKPVIGTAVRGTRDLIEDGAGLLVPVGDVGAIADAMRRIIREPEQAHQMGRRGRELASQYDVRRIVESHARLYEQVPRWN
jgi:glycosyltransferase involved in cell wall biosynthesis